MLILEIHKLSEVELDLLLRQHTVATLGGLSKTSESKPWETPQIDAGQTDSYPKQIVLTKANMLYVPLANLSAKCVNVFKRIAAIMTQHDVKVTISDKTNHGRSINVTFKGELLEEQQKAMEAFAEHNIETLSATTAFGKTVFAIGMMAKRKVNTLILVHNKALLEHWKERLEPFLKIDETIEEPKTKRGSKKKSSVIGCLYAARNRWCMGRGTYQRHTVAQRPHHLAHRGDRWRRYTV